MVVVLCGLFLLNSVLNILFIGDKALNDNFENNRALLQLNVNNTESQMSLRFIETLPKDKEYFLFPHISEETNYVSIHAQIPKKPLSCFSCLPHGVPQEFIKLLGFKNISKEKWENEPLIILGEKWARDFHLKYGDKIEIRPDGNEFLQSNLTAEEQRQYLKNAKPIVLQVVGIAKENFDGALPDISRGVYTGHSYVSIKTIKEIAALCVDRSVSQYQGSIKIDSGFTVVVRNFDNVDKVAKRFKDMGFTVTYALSQFQSLSTIVGIAKISTIFLIVLVGIILVVTVSNALMQLFYYRRSEIGLMLSIGISKKDLLSSFLLENVYQYLCIFIIIIPFQIIFNRFVVDKFTELNIVDYISPNLTSKVIIADVIIILIILPIGLILSQFQMYKRKTSELIKVSE
jgi:hypothetical protein